MSKINNKGQFVLLKMRESGIIPTDGFFEITEDLIVKYMDTYRALFSKTTKRVNMGMNSLARKIAGMSLLKELENRQEHVKSKAGMVYMISNPSFPSYVKIGMTVNLETRLKTYQTYDPHRQFKVEHYEFVCDRFITEKKILNSFLVNLEQGEWIQRPNATKIFHDIIQNRIS